MIQIKELFLLMLCRNRFVFLHENKYEEKKFEKRLPMKYVFMHFDLIGEKIQHSLSFELGFETIAKLKNE